MLPFQEVLGNANTATTLRVFTFSTKLNAAITVLLALGVLSLAWPRNGVAITSDAHHNAELAELKRLASEAPIDELVENWLRFSDLYATNYRRDDTLIGGIERLVDYVVERHQANDRKIMATFLSQVIERGDPRIQSRLAARIDELRRIR